MIFNITHSRNALNFPYYISVFVHVICAAFWTGGMLFLPLVLLPSIKNNEERLSILIKAGIRFRNFGMLALVLAAVTGITNMYFRGVEFSWDMFNNSSYGRLVMLKIKMFVFMIIVYSIHDYVIGSRVTASNNASDKIIRKLASWSRRIALVISLFMIFIGIIISRGGF